MNFSPSKLFARLADAVVRRSSLANAFMRGDDFSSGRPDALFEPYRNSAWVQRAIKHIAQPVASVSVDFYARLKAARLRRRARRSNDDGEPIAIPALEEFLQAPGAGLAYSDLVESFIGWLKLAGEVFWLLPDDTVPFPEAEGGSIHVIVARPDRMRHVVEDGRIVAWEYTDAARRRWALPPEQVIHTKNWNPYDEYRGLGEFEAARIAAQSAFLSGKFKRNLAGNNGDTGPYLICKSGVPTDDQRQQILHELRSKRYAQLRGEFQPMFISGDIAVEDPQIRSVDAAFISSLLEDRHEIFAAFGVPPSMADVKAAYSIGSASDFFQLITGTCMPAGRKFCGALEQLAMLSAKMSVEAELDWDEHPVMQEVRKERMQSVETLWSKGMPMRDISEYLDLGLPEFEGWDVGYLPFSAAPVGTAGPEQDQNLAEGDQAGDEVVQEMMRVLKAKKAIRDSRSSVLAGRAVEGHDDKSCGCSLVEKDLDPKRDPKELAQWRDHIAKRRGTIRAYESKFNRVLFEARAEVLQNIANKKLLFALSTRAAAVDFIFDLVKFKGGLTAALRSAGTMALQTAGEQLFKEVGRDDPWSMPPAKAIQFLAERDNKLSNVAEEVFNQITASLQEGLTKGDTMTDLADRVRAEFGNVSKVRATRIAMTETAAAYGVARQEAMEVAGIKSKKWLTSGNSNVRAAHRAMNGATVAVDAPFMVIDPKTGDSDQVQHPGDPLGAPWNVINCHCVAVATTEPDQQAEPAQ